MIIAVEEVHTRGTISPPGGSSHVGCVTKAKDIVVEQWDQPLASAKREAPVVVICSHFIFLAPKKKCVSGDD